MTPPKPKMDLINSWFVRIAVVAFTIAYGEMRLAIGSNTRLLSENQMAYSQLRVIDSMLSNHLREPAHGTAGQRLTANEREIAVLAAQMREILRRLGNIDRKLAEPNGSGK